MKKYSTDYDEEYVKNLLKLLFPNKYSNLTKNYPTNKSPDLIDNNESLGVEVTSGMSSTKYKNALVKQQDAKTESEIINFQKNNFGLEISQEDKKKNYDALSLNAKKRIFYDKLPDSNQYFLWSFSYFCANKIKDSICFKIKKLNAANSSYVTLKEINLFIIANGPPPSSINEMQEIKKFTENYLDKTKYKKKFNTIFVLFIDNLFIFQPYGDIKEDKISLENLKLAKKLTDNLL